MGETVVCMHTHVHTNTDVHTQGREFTCTDCRRWLATITRQELPLPQIQMHLIVISMKNCAHSLTNLMLSKEKQLF